MLKNAICALYFDNKVLQRYSYSITSH